MSADNIDALPTDENTPSHGEIQLLDTFFKQNQSTMQKILSETKDILVMGFLFLIFSLPQADELLNKLIPATKNSVYTLILIKALFFMGLYFVIKNIYMVRKK